MTAQLECGIYGTDIEVYYVTPTGRVWIVVSPDFENGPVEIKPEDLPAEAEMLADAITNDVDLTGCED